VLRSLLRADLRQVLQSSFPADRFLAGWIVHLQEMLLRKLRHRL
jgi:hypothetical protein